MQGPGTRARRARWSAVVLVAALLAAGCGGDDDEGEGPGTTGGGTGSGATGEPGWAGELRVLSGESATMDPARLKTESSSEWDRAAAIYDTLLRWRADGSYTGQLAESMTSDDGVTWTIRLREGITFTDGTALDAEAVLFNLERLRDPANASGMAGALADVTAMSAPDPLTVELVLGSPNGTFWEPFASIAGMVGSPTAIAADEEGFGGDPVGAGPYVLVERQRDSFLLLERNPDYWDSTKPAYETVRVQIAVVPLSRAQAIRAGEADVTHAGGIAMLTALGDPAASGFRVERIDAATMVLLNHEQGPASDLRVRQAISLAFDPARVNASIMGGLWDSEELVCPPFDPGAAECAPGLWPGFDPARATELVADYAAEGGSVAVELLTNPGVQSEAEFIQQALNTIGLDVTLDVAPPAEWLPQVNAGDFDIAWYATSQPVTTRLFQFFKSDQRNLARTALPELDEALTRARTSLAAEERLEAWTEVQEIMAEETLVAWYAPFMDGYVVREGIAVGDQLRTVHLHFSELSPA